MQREGGFSYRIFLIPLALLASGCAMALPSPQMSRARGVAPVAQVVQAARLHHFDTGKDAAVQRFFKNGPGTVAVADLLHLGQFSPSAHSTTAVGLLGQGLMTGGIAAGLNPLGGALFLLGAAGGQKTYPKWADRYRWMSRDAAHGEVLQVVAVYALGSNREQTSEREATALGIRCLQYLSTLPISGSATVPVTGSGYSELGNFGSNKLMEHFFIGTTQKDRAGNLSLIWWEENHLTAVGSVLMMKSSFSGKAFMPFAQFVSTKNMSADYNLSRIECMTVPGDSREGLAVATFLIKHPNRFHESASYRYAIRYFSQDYLILERKPQAIAKGPAPITVWHEGKSETVFLPNIL